MPSPEEKKALELLDNLSFDDMFGIFYQSLSRDKNRNCYYRELRDRVKLRFRSEGTYLKDFNFHEHGLKLLYYIKEINSSRS